MGTGGDTIEGLASNFTFPDTQVQRYAARAILQLVVDKKAGDPLPVRLSGRPQTKVKRCSLFPPA